MKKLLKTVSMLALIVGLAFGGMAVVSTPATAECWAENTDYDGEAGEQNCLGGTCTAGWCCVICVV